MIWTAIILGLTSSLHCGAMCGPIAMILPYGPYHINKLFYQLGRISTYSLLGIIVGFIGESISFSGISHYISFVAGSLVIIFILIPDKYYSGQFGLFNSLKVYLFKQLSPQQHGKFFISGMINGLLPCGMVYIALAASLYLNSIYSSVLYMVLFGLATLPVFGFMLVLQQNVIRFMKNYAFIKRVLICGIGILMIVRGLNLGIPYISPDIEAKTIEACK